MFTVTDKVLITILVVGMLITYTGMFWNIWAVGPQYTLSLMMVSIGGVATIICFVVIILRTWSY